MWRNYKYIEVSLAFLTQNTRQASAGISLCSLWEAGQECDIVGQVKQCSSYLWMGGLEGLGGPDGQVDQKAQACLVGP